MRFDSHKLQLGCHASVSKTRAAVLCLLAIFALMAGGLITAFASTSADAAARAAIRPVDRIAQPVAARPSLTLADVPPPQYDSLPDLAAEFEVLTRNYRAGVTSLVDDLAPAKPFLYKGAYGDLTTATDCLATAAWYEAGDKPMEQRSVIQVVLNRVNHPSFPKSVCGVVFQGADRTTGCQFSFTCDGSMARRAPSPAAWSRAKELAMAALSGAVDPYVGQATHFHADYVAPWWSSDLEPVAQVGAHIFYRWRSDAGKVRGPPRLAAEVARPAVTDLGRVSREADLLSAAPELAEPPANDAASSPAAITALLDAPVPASRVYSNSAALGYEKPATGRQARKSAAAPIEPAAVAAPESQGPDLPIAQADPASFDPPALASAGDLGLATSPPVAADALCESGTACETAQIANQIQLDPGRIDPGEIGNGTAQIDPALAPGGAGPTNCGQPTVQLDSTGQCHSSAGSGSAPDQLPTGQPAGNPVASIQ